MFANLRRSPSIGVERSDLFRLLVRGGSFPSIASLRQSIGPAAVARLVPFVRVDSVEGHPAWTLPHIRQEALEFAPSVTDRCAYSAVARVARTARIATPLDHAIPRLVRPGSVHSVCSLPFRRHLPDEAPARPYKTSSEAVYGRNLCFAAVASAAPQAYSTAHFSGRGNGDEATKTLV